MTLNCKQGDLAIVIRSWAGNDGKIVQCIRLANSEESKPVLPFCKGTLWVVDCKIRFITSYLGQDVLEEFFEIFPDELLRPIRDQPVDDEMIRIAGLPQDRILEVVR